MPFRRLIVSAVPGCYRLPRAGFGTAVRIVRLLSDCHSDAGHCQFEKSLLPMLSGFEASLVQPKLGFQRIDAFRGLCLADALLKGVRLIGLLAQRLEIGSRRAGHWVFAADPDVGIFFGSVGRVGFWAFIGHRKLPLARCPEKTHTRRSGSVRMILDRTV